MKQSITIKWFFDDDETISQAQKDELYQAGIERADDQIEQGFSSGELYYCFYDDVTKETEEYRGWWELN